MQSINLTLQIINANYTETFDTLEKLIDYDRHGEHHGKVYDGELNFGNIEDVWDVMVADLNNGFPLPAGMTDQLWQNLTELDTLNWFVIESGCPTAVQLQNTAIFQSWMDNFDMAIKKKDFSEGLKWAMYSGHDNNVASAMVGLGFSDWQCNVEKFQTGTTDALNCNQRPYFAASIILELHKIDDKFQVAVKFDGKYQNLCGKEETFCDYDAFKETMSEQILSPEEIEEVCEVKQSILKQISQNVNLTGVVVTIIMVFLIVVVFFAILVQAGRYQQNKIQQNQNIGNRKQQSKNIYSQIENTV